MKFANRLASVRGILKKSGLDVAIITKLENIRYLSGFTGSDGVLMVTPDKVFFLSDSRYTAQAEIEVIADRRIEYKKKFDAVSKILTLLKSKRAGFEGSLTFDEYRAIEKKVSKTKLSQLPEDFKSLRTIKDAGEIKTIKMAIQIAESSWNDSVKYLIHGNIEKEFALNFEFSAKKGGASRLSFDTIVASGARSAMPHWVASEEEMKRAGFVVVDFGCMCDGYCSDETMTCFLGKPLKKHLEIFGIVRKAQDEAVKKIRDGAKTKEVDAAARNYIEKKGYGKFFGHGTGHGVGMEVHEPPAVSPISKDTLKEGMVITIEPGIYIPDFGGVRLEDMFLVTKEGCEKLTSLEKKLRILD